MELGIVLVEAEEDVPGPAPRDAEDAGLDALERSDVPVLARLGVDDVDAPVLIAAGVLEVDQVAAVLGPAVRADAAVRVRRHRPRAVAFEVADPDVQDV